MPRGEAKAKSKAGRKPTGKYAIAHLCNVIDEYTQTSEYPILKEVCLDNDWDYAYLCQLEARNHELAKSIKKLHDKREVILEKGAVSGQFDKTFAIFRLKQPVHGWNDRQDKPENDSGGLTLNVIKVEPVNVPLLERRELLERVELMDVHTYGVDDLINRRIANHALGVRRELERAFFDKAALAASAFTPTATETADRLEELI